MYSFKAKMKNSKVWISQPNVMKENIEEVFEILREYEKIFQGLLAQIQIIRIK